MIRDVPITLPDGRIKWLKAGPTREMPDGYKLIRCAAEIEVNPDDIAVDISTADFKPFNPADLERELPNIMRMLSEDEEPLYAGCMGGTGRTGTILAIIAAQHPDLHGDRAIHYIRTVYKAHAVETAEQKAQVREFSAAKPFPENRPTPGSAMQYDEPRGVVPRFLAWLGFRHG